MIFACLYTVVGLIYLLPAAGLIQIPTPLRVLLIWMSLVCFSLGAAYFMNKPGWTGKKSNGLIPVLYRIPFAPYYLILEGLWRTRFFFSKEDPYNEIVPGIYVGRRLKEKEIPGFVKTAADLTCEFQEPESFRGINYYCLPTLDGSIPEKEKFLDFIRILKNAPPPLYIHCAAGHGRAGLTIAALLLSRGDVDAGEEAIKMARSKRAKINLNKTQKNFLTGLTKDLKNSLNPKTRSRKI